MIYPSPMGASALIFLSESMDSVVSLRRGPYGAPIFFKDG